MSSTTTSATLTRGCNPCHRPQHCSNGLFSTAATTSRLAMFRLFGLWRTVFVNSWYICGAVQGFDGLKMFCFTKWTLYFVEVLCVCFIELYSCCLLNRPLEIRNHELKINPNSLATALFCLLSSLSSGFWRSRLSKFIVQWYILIPIVNFCTVRKYCASSILKSFLILIETYKVSVD